MIDLYLNKIEEERSAWASELLFYRHFLDRAEMDEEQEKQILFCHGCCMAIIKELEELKGDIVNLKNEFQNFYIYSEEMETNGEKWTRFYTLLYLVVKGEEGVGLQKKYVNVKFNKLIDLKPYKEGGIFILRNGKYTLPQIYEVKINEKTGKKELPFMYIHEIAGYSELENDKRRPSQK